MSTTTSTTKTEKRATRPARSEEAGSWADPHAEWRAPKVERSLGGSTGENASGLLSVMFQLTKLDVLKRPFAQSGVVYACVQVRAKLISEARPALWVSEEEDAKELPPTDPLVALLRKPNPIMGRIKFLRTVSQHFDLAGGTFLFLTAGTSDKPISPGQMPGALWPVREDHVQINFGPGNVPESYEFTVAQERVKFPAHAVAHVYDSDPDNPLRGIGPMQAAWRTANNLFRSEAFDDALVETGGQIGGLLVPTGDVEVSEQERKELADSMQQQHLQPRKSGRVAVMPRGFDFKEMQFSPRDMQAKDFRILGRNHVMMIFGVTPPLLGIVEDVNRANGREARRVFYEGHGIPQLEFIADEVNAQLLPMIGYGGRAVFGFDTSGIAALREDALAVQQRVRGWMEMGRSFEEACSIERVDFDYKGWEGVEDRYRATALVPLSLDEKALAQEDDPDAEEDLDGLPGDAPPADSEAASFGSGLSHHRRRSLAVEFDVGLRKFDAAIERRVHKKFKEFLLAQRKRLREVAAGARDLAVNGHRARSWRWFDEERRLDPQTHGWYDVRGITEHELESLMETNLVKWGEELWADLEPVIVSAMEHAAGWAAARVGVEPFPVAQDPRVLDFLDKKEVLLKEGPFGELAQQVKRALIRGMEGSTGEGTLAQRVAAVLRELEGEMKVLQDRIGYRAAMIARTEVTAAANGANAIQYAEAGVQRHEWLSSGDDLVRKAPFDHSIDGEPARIGERFSNGLRWPGDSSGDAGNVVNCRCTTLPIIEDHP